MGKVIEGSSHSSRTILLLVIVGLPLLWLNNSCSVFSRKPPTLSGSSDQHGLVIVECSIVREVKHLLVTRKGTIDPTRCALGRVGEPEFVTYAGVFDSLFVFSGLEPGLYFVRMVEGTRKYRYVFPEGIVEEMTFTVAAGIPIYIGVVAITERHCVAAGRPTHTWTFNQKDYKDTVEYRPEPAAETRAWAWFVERYGETRWGRIVKKML